MKSLISDSDRHARSTTTPEGTDSAADSGEELWRDKLPADAMTTPITYEAGGRQFLVIVSGGHVKVHAVRGDSVIAYALPAEN